MADRSQLNFDSIGVINKIFPKRTIRVKKTFLMATLSMLLIGSLLTTSRAAQDSGPRAVFVEKAVDLKEVSEGRDIEHAFRIQNQGDQPLKIEKVKPG